MLLLQQARSVFFFAVGAWVRHGMPLSTCLQQIVDSKHAVGLTDMQQTMIVVEAAPGVIAVAFLLGDGARESARLW